MDLAACRFQTIMCLDLNTLRAPFDHGKDCEAITFSGDSMILGGFALAAIVWTGGSACGLCRYSSFGLTVCSGALLPAASFVLSDNHRLVL